MMPERLSKSSLSTLITFLPNLGSSKQKFNDLQKIIREFKSVNQTIEAKALAIVVLLKIQQ